MNEKILEKLHTALYDVAPLSLDREDIISAMGEVIWLESLQLIVSKLPEEKKQIVITFLNDGKFDEASTIIADENIDVDIVIQEIARNVLDDTIKAGKE